MEATSTGVGMDLAAGCHGVPVSYRGAGSSAVILRVVPCRNFPSVRMVQSGSRVKDSLRMEGEAGAGFAVVANSMQDLAEQSAAIYNNIEESVQGITDTFSELINIFND